MRNVARLTEPSILTEKKEEWKSALLVDRSDNNQNRYRHQEIKQTLLTETDNKCVYCESKIGHNCPGDIEHKVPKSKRTDLTFEWDNMTIACTECNRKKGEYYEPDCMFLDPYTDDVENLVQHLGPIVYNRPGNIRSEVTLRILQLNSIEGRAKLVGRKMDRLEAIKNLVERIATIKNPTLKSFLRQELAENCQIRSEFSGMVKTYVEGLPSNWDTD
jgi:uncharacterized protein (TIGR02646 family)